MSASITVDIDREITFQTARGGRVQAHGVALVLEGNGTTEPPAARLVFRVAPKVYDDVLAASLFALTPEVRGEPVIPFVRDREIEIDARLRGDVAAALIAQGGGARELVDALVAGTTDLAADASWQALSVVQEIDTPAGAATGAVKSGYRTALADPDSMIAVATRAAERAGTPLEDAGDGLHRFESKSSAGEWTTLVWIDELTRVCAVYSVLREQVPAERRADVAQYLVDRNYYLNVASFEMDVEDGEVRLRTSIDATHATFDEAMFINLVAANLSLFELHLPTLAALVTGELTLAQARAKHG